MPPKNRIDWYSNFVPWKTPKQTFRKKSKCKGNDVKIKSEWKKWRWFHDENWHDKKINPADRASYFTVITQFISTQQTFKMFDFEFSLSNFSWTTTTLWKTEINSSIKKF